MADFSKVYSDSNGIRNDFNVNVQDNFGRSINSEILDEIENLILQTMEIENNEKRISLLQINNLLIEARSLVPEL
ncbi:hypothetical protein [Campylobacter devanensis]|uniref:hypothetical protein n=1 Tax=Campylobacter devanensis TaxID=3161138 RepID=UPI000A359815|nr:MULTISPECIES: hypothetical protein [unclassified Campylobacter]